MTSLPTSSSPPHSILLQPQCAGKGSSQVGHPSREHPHGRWGVAGKIHLLVLPPFNKSGDSCSCCKGCPSSPPCPLPAAIITLAYLACPNGRLHLPSSHPFAGKGGKNQISQNGSPPMHSLRSLQGQRGWGWREIKGGDSMSLKPEKERRMSGLQITGIEDGDGEPPMKHLLCPVV